MNDQHARAVWLMAWAPLSAWLLLALEQVIGAPWFNPLQVILGLLTLLMAGATPVIWRLYVVRTRRGLVLTLALSGAMLANVVAWQPLLPVGGCGAAEIMIASQSLVLTGVWLGGCVFAWWGGLCLARSPVLRSLVHGSRLMSADVARLLVCLSLFPLLYGLAGLYLMTEQYVAGDTNEWSHARALLLVHALAVAVPVALWRRRVRWTRTRVLGTLLLAGLFLASAGAPLYALWLSGWEATTTSPAWQPFGALLDASPLLGQALWIAGVACLWRYGARETPPGLKHAALDVHLLARCAACQYDLRGQREIRCPECGWASTVDELLSAKLGQALEL